MARTKVRTSQLSADHWSVEYLLPVVQLPITIQCWDIVFCLAKAHPACQWFDPPATWRWSDPDSWPFSPGNQASGIDPFNSTAMFHGELFDFEGTCHFPSYHFISTISYYIKNYIPGSLYLILYIYIIPMGVGSILHFCHPKSSQFTQFRRVSSFALLVVSCTNSMKAISWSKSHW